MNLPASRSQQKKMPMKWLLTPLVFVTTSVHAMDGNNLLERCTATGVDRAYAQISCQNYVRGVVDGYTVATAYSPDTAAFKLPKGVTGQQLQDIAVKYLRDHAENRHAPAALLIALAMIEAFPK